MDEKQIHLNTGAVDLYAPAYRFASASQLYGRLHRWWLLLRKYGWLPALISVAVVGSVGWLTVLTGPTYESNARLWVPGRINVSDNWSYTEELVNFLGTQAELLQSPNLQRRALARMSTEAKPDSEVGGLPSAVPVNFLGETKALLVRLLSSTPADTNGPLPIPFKVKVLEGAKSSTLDLRVIGRSPVATQDFLNCLMAEYLDFKGGARTQASTQAAASLNAQGAQLKSELAAAEDKLEAFQASNNVVLLQQQGSGAENYLATLSRQLAVLRTEQHLLESLQPEQWVQTDAAQFSGDEAAARQGLASLAQSQTTLFQADQEMHLLMARRDDLSRLLRAEHPKIIKLDQDIAAQQQIVQVAKEEAAKQLALRRQAVEAQIHNLEEASKEWDAKAADASRKVAAYQQLQQTGQRLQAAYDKTFDLIQNLEVAHRVEQENVAILDAASVAKPTHRLLLNLAIAVAVALGLGLFSLYGLTLLRDDFVSSTELAGHLGETTLGQIPAISFGALNRLKAGAIDRQRFEFLEAFRNLRTALLHLNLEGKRPKTLVITSSLPGEGKSTVALYLAVTLAKGRARVLLIDGDMRRPSLHRFFGLAPFPGLAEVLNGEISADGIVVDTELENLGVLPAGTAKQNPGDLVLSPAWESFLAKISSEFDFILVDTPPVAATDDAASLAPKADGVLFVVRASATSARVAHGALEVMRQRKTRVAGLVLNRAVSSPYQRQYYEPYAADYVWKPGELEPGAGALANHTARHAPSAAPREKIFPAA